MPKPNSARPTKFIPNKVYTLDYAWTDPIKGAILAPTDAIFTGKIYVLNSVEYGEFIHVDNKKVRKLSLAMLAGYFMAPDRVIAPDDEWLFPLTEEEATEGL